MKIYHLKTCDTCRKAIKAIKAAGHIPELIDVRADGVPAADLAKVVQAVGYENLLNTRSTTWRGLDTAEKEDIDLDKALSLMGEHPTLIKRPVIMDGEKITIGWAEAVQDIWL